jgi:hypothetical protein
VLCRWRLGYIGKIHSYVWGHSSIFDRALTFRNGPWKTLSLSDMVITCGKALGQAHYQNSMVLLVVACYSSNITVHGCIQLYISEHMKEGWYW